MNDYYAILGLEKVASLRDIKNTYRTLAKKYHPDVNTSPEAARYMQSLNESYAVLGDPIKRAEYDQMREMGGSTSQVATEQHIHVTCAKCGKVDSTLRVSTFTTVWSFVFFSTYRGWAKILCAKCRVIESLKFNLQALCCGWWGIPWGVIWTVVFFIKNALGGHQPRENNAILLATVGRNLIDAGDYIEAEKALIESLKLNDNVYVQNLLKTAKSQAGFKKEKSHVEKVVALESHPLIYNLFLLGAILALIGALIFGSSVFPPGVNGQASAAQAESGSQILPNDKEKEALYEKNIQAMLQQSWFGMLAAKINLLRGERWSIPFQLGDSREHVYQVLGDPADNSDQYVAVNQHFQNELGLKEDAKFWMDKGIVVSFKDDVVSSITIGGYEFATKVNTNPIVYGIYSTDNVEALKSKLGLPYLPNSTNSNLSVDVTEFEWRIGNLRITRDILAAEETDDVQKKCPVGSPWGGVTIEALTPIEQDEKNEVDDARIKKEKVVLSGKEINSKEIFERYKDRIYVVISYDSQGKPASFGTGFLYKNSQIISNYHVVEDARTIKVKPLNTDGKEEEVAVELVDTNADWVLLDKFHNFNKKNSEPYPEVEHAESVETGDAVTVIGNPEGLTGSLSTGVVSSIRTDDGVDWVQITAPISHGSSGSPVFDSIGRWIGIATLSIIDGQNLNLATPAKGIVTAINSQKEIKQMDLPLKSALYTSEDYQELISKSESSDPATVEFAIKGLTELLDEYPDPSDQDTLLGDIYAAMPKTADSLKILDKQIALNIEGNYTPLENKGDILWNLENQNNSLNPDHTESYQCYTQAIEVAKSSIKKEIDEETKKYADLLLPNIDGALKKHIEEKCSKNIQYIENKDALDAYEIGRMYFVLGDYQNAEKWLKLTKSWLTYTNIWGAQLTTPQPTELNDQADAILNKINNH